MRSLRRDIARGPLRAGPATRDETSSEATDRGRRRPQLSPRRRVHRQPHGWQRSDGGQNRTAVALGVDAPNRTRATPVRDHLPLRHRWRHSQTRGSSRLKKSSASQATRCSGQLPFYMPCHPRVASVACGPSTPVSVRCCDDSRPHRREHRGRDESGASEYVSATLTRCGAPFRRRSRRTARSAAPRPAQPSRQHRPALLILPVTTEGLKVSHVAVPDLPTKLDKIGAAFINVSDPDRPEAAPGTTAA